MLEPLENDELLELMRAFAGLVSQDVPREFDPEPHLSDHFIVLSTAAIETAATSLARHAERHATSHARLACTLLTFTYSGGLRFQTTLGRRADLELCATAATLVAEIQAKRGGLSVLGGITQLELVTALTDPQIGHDQRREVVTNLCQQAAHIVRAPLQPLPPTNAPIIYLATPISRIDQDTYDYIRPIAERVVAVIESYGYHADYPGRELRPDSTSNADHHARVARANSALNYLSGLITLSGEHGGRGMGYAVRRAEDNGVPVLFLTEEFAPFARVFGGDLARRVEGRYDDADEAELLVRQFLDETADQIVAAFNDQQAALGLEEQLRSARGALARVDPAMFRSRRLTLERANHLLDSPIHFEHAQKWELRELSELLNQAMMTLGDNRNPPPAASRPVPRQGMSPRSWQGLKTARRMGDWPADHVIELVDEVLEFEVSSRSKPRPPDISADAWTKRHQIRFPSF
jgi:hypothetical protein